LLLRLVFSGFMGFTYQHLYNRLRQRRPLRIKEQETSLILHEHDDDDDDL